MGILAVFGDEGWVGFTYVDFTNLPTKWFNVPNALFFVSETNFLQYATTFGFNNLELYLD